MTGGGILYPVLGTGCFFVLFWFGVSLAHGLGLHGLTILAVGLVAGCAGAGLAAGLERSDPAA